MSQIESVRKARTFEELLSDNIDAVMISSPDEYHFVHIEKALTAGKHIFCEKPLLVPGESIERLQAVIKLAREKHLIITSCHPRRYDVPGLWMKKELPDFQELYGKVIGFAFDFSYHAPSAAWKHSRSLLLDHLNHEVDLMNFFFGIQSFSAWKLHDGHDHYEVVGQRDDRINFHFRGTRRLVSERYPEWFRIRLERAEVIVSTADGVAEIRDHNCASIQRLSNLCTDYDARLDGVAHDFAQSIRTGKWGYLSEAEMVMNSEAGIILQREGIQRVEVRA